MPMNRVPEPCRRVRLPRRGSKARDCLGTLILLAAGRLQVKGLVNDEGLGGLDLLDPRDLLGIEFQQIVVVVQKDDAFPWSETKWYWAVCQWDIRFPPLRFAFANLPAMRYSSIA